MTQRANPHPQLVTARNAAIEYCGMSRAEACKLIDQVSDEAVESILAAKGDKSKIKAALRTGIDAATVDEVVAEKPEGRPIPKRRRSGK